MLIGPKFIYFARYNDKFLYEQNGSIKESTTPIPIVFGPDGWQDFSITVERNKKYFGLDRASSLPLKYVKDGGMIVKYVIYTYGFNKVVDILVAERKLHYDGITYGLYYTVAYKSQLDPFTFIQERSIVNANLVEGGIKGMIKANENVTQEIDISDCPTLYNDGVDLIGKQNFAFLDGLLITHNMGLGTWAAPIVKLEEEGQSTGLSFFDVNLEGTGDTLAYYETSNNYLTLAFENNLTSIDTKLNGIVNIKLVTRRTFVPFTLRFVKAKKGWKANVGLNPTDYITEYTIFDNGGPGYPYLTNNGDTASIPFNLTIPLNSEDRIFPVIIRNAFGSNTTSDWEFMKDSNFSANYTNRYAPNTHYVIEPEELFKRIIHSITKGTGQAISDYLRENKDLVTSSGAYIRNLENAKYKTTFSEFFDSYNMTRNIGFGIVNGVARIERKEFFYNTNTVTLTNVNKRVVSVNQDYMFNQLFFGYNDVDTKEVNGLNEYNVMYEWAVDVGTLQKELRIISPYGGGCYEIEFGRILKGKTTTDNPSDNKNFFFKVIKDYIRPDGSLEIDRSLNAVTTGALSLQSIYNLDISPKRCMLLHGWYLHGFFYKMDDKYIEYKASQKNNNVSIAGISERSDVYIGDLAPAKFIPFNIDVEAVGVEELVQDAARGFSFTIDNVTTGGIALKTAIELNTRKAQNITLLSFASNDLSKLTYTNQ